MPKIAELLFDRAELTIPIGNGEIKVTFRPRVLLPSWQEKIRAAETSGAGYEAAIYEPIKAAVVSWDVEQDDGTPYPITSEAMAEIPNAILASVLLGLIAAARPNQVRVLGSSIVGSSEPLSLETKRRSGTS